VQRVFYATDRKRSASAIANDFFTGERGELSLGLCYVSIPRDHRLGQLEAPSIFRLEFSENLARHVVLQTVSPMTREGWLRMVGQRVGQSPRKRAFVFIHGYNVSFAEAARRTAQISYDLAFDGAPVFYSWPSQGTEVGYTRDEQNIEWAQTNVRAFLDLFFSSSGADEVYLIAHSMGNRALTRAVGGLLTEKPEYRARLKEVILAAPDVDAEVFRRDIAPALANTGRPITLYASSGDKALQLSKQVHGYPRAGDSGPGLLVMPGIETVDASLVETGFLGHSYFADTRSVIGDIFELIRSGSRAASRGALTQVSTPTGPYWQFRP
jgi:esterase/lipase superfamily enzyme